MFLQLMHCGRIAHSLNLPAGARVLAPSAVAAAQLLLKKEKTLVGFREKRSPFVADIEACEVLHPAVGKKLPELRTLIDSLSNYNQIPQIEVAISDAKNLGLDQ